MKIKGKHPLPTNVEALWSMLQDEKVLTRIAPGLSYITKEGEDRYKAVSNISIGPVRGKFEGSLMLMDKKHHEEMTMVMEQKSKIGNAEATIIMHLSNPNKDETLITYDGSAKVSGTLASMGQRILGGVISTLTKQVFQELEKVILENKEELEKEGEKKIKVKSTSKKDHNIFQSIITQISKLWKLLFR